MATSERILTTIPGAAGAQPVVGRSYVASGRSAVIRVIMDFLTLSLGFTLIPALISAKVTAIASYYQRLSPIALALMGITIFAFSGSYPRYRTPLHIADTAGLLRGSSCALLLLAISYMCTRSVPDGDFIVVLAFVLLCLIVQRELLHILNPRMSGTLLFDVCSEDGRYQIQEAGGFSFIEGDVRGLAERLVKRAMDIIGAAIVLVVALPFLVAVSALIKLDSDGPVFIRQKRIGRNGKNFSMWKFRSMNARVQRYARSPVSDADPRLTRLGRTLRRFSIDEVPQLLNVLKGDMSLVGPRPEMPFIVENYDSHQRLRLNALPGITGLWQISPARAMPIHDNVGLDLFYIQNQGIFLDLAILLRTVTAVFRGIGAA